jgi:hypothetical protein
VWCSSTWEDAAHKLSSSKLYKTIIQTKENLAKKNCLDNDTCEVCNSATESAAHLMAGCSFSAGFWRRIGVELTEEAVADLWNVGPPPHIPSPFQCLGATMLLAIVEVQTDISPYVVRVIVMEYKSYLLLVVRIFIILDRNLMYGHHRSSTSAITRHAHPLNFNTVAIVL